MKKQIVYIVVMHAPLAAKTAIASLSETLGKCECCFHRMLKQASTY
jgi:hypothetical protein